MTVAVKNAWYRNRAPHRALTFNLHFVTGACVVDAPTDEEGKQVVDQSALSLSREEVFHIDAPSVSVHSTPLAVRRYARALLTTLLESYQMRHRLRESYLPLFTLTYEHDGQQHQLCAGGGR